MTNDEQVKRVAHAMKKRASEPLANIKSLELVLVGGLGDAWDYLAVAAIEAMRAAPAEATGNNDRIIEVMGVPYAREALGRIRAAGFEVVPREPTETMISAANRLNHPRDEEVWRTMIDAYRNTEITPQSSG